MGGIIISVVSNKGGIGKTTVACNLGHALTRNDKKVLVIDNDPQGNATSLLMPKGSNPDYTLYELLDPEEKASVEKCVNATQFDNLWCIPNVPETANLEPDIITHQDFTAFKERVRPYAIDQYDYVLIDNPPNLGSFVINSLCGSDFVIVPNLANSSFSVDGLIKAVDMINRIQKSHNADLRFLRLLINQVDRRKSISKYNISQIKQHFPADKMFETMIPTNAPFEIAESRGTTIFRQAPASNGCKAYRQLAKELIGIFER